jgi:hypothetical protein
VYGSPADDARSRPSALSDRRARADAVASQVDERVIAQRVVVALDGDVADRPAAAETDLAEHAAGVVLALLGVDLAAGLLIEDPEISDRRRRR